VSGHGLDVLLERARPREPSDDGFTEIVMQSVRTHRPRRFRGRFVTRPAVLAAAAVLATGGAIAAAVRTTVPAAPTSTTSVMAPSSPGAGVRALPGRHAPSSAGATGASPRRSTAAPSARQTGGPFRDAAYEWAYTSPHSAYVLDRSTGLRLTVDTRVVSIDSARALELTVTLANTSSHPIAITTQSGCALSAAGWRGTKVDPRTPPESRNPATANEWMCTGGRDARTNGSDEVVLAPGGTQLEVVRLAVTRGAWAIAGVCRCGVVGVPSPARAMQPSILKQLPLAGIDASQRSEMLTPAIGVNVG
jgi:hypothetical protein